MLQTSTWRPPTGLHATWRLKGVKPARFVKCERMLVTGCVVAAGRLGVAGHHSTRTPKSSVH